MLSQEKRPDNPIGIREFVLSRNLKSGNWIIILLIPCFVTEETLAIRKNIGKLKKSGTYSLRTFLPIYSKTQASLVFLA